jgi:enoyl-CoA hydratase/carnithine racemase
MKDRVSISIDRGVADVRLIRADKMNALDERMFDALVEAAASLRDDPEVRCVVLSGEGRAFCAGIDMAALAELSGMGSPRARTLAERTHGIANKPQQAVWAWHELPVPVIAAVHGVAFGGGFQLMLGADMRFVAPDTKLSVMEAKWGLVPDMAGTILMRRLARDDVIRELTYTARVFSADDALTYGFATRICEEPRQVAMETAREIASRSPSAIEAAKRLLNRVPDLPEAEALLLESVEQDAIIGKSNQIEAVMSQKEGREARFQAARGR